MQAAVWKADGFLGAAVIVALALVAVAIYFVLMRKHAPPAVSKPKLAGPVRREGFGRFVIERQLAKGASGVVYLGRERSTGRRVAIKTFPLAPRFQPEDFAEVKERFLRAAEKAARLSHANVVAIYDAGEEDDHCYMAMEVLPGTSLAHYTRRAELLPPEKAVALVARAAEALAYAHRQGVVHGDVKPAQLMYHPQNDTLKVTDFCIGRAIGNLKIAAGSYMSPEQLGGRRIDGRADLFSLAVTLYQLLCGRLPFEGASAAQMMFRIANEPPALPAIEIPAALAQFLERALAKDAGERFQTGEHFSGALRAALAPAVVDNARAWT